MACRSARLDELVCNRLAITCWEHMCIVTGSTQFAECDLVGMPFSPFQDDDVTGDGSKHGPNLKNVSSFRSFKESFLWNSRRCHDISIPGDIGHVPQHAALDPRERTLFALIDVLGFAVSNVTTETRPSVWPWRVELPLIVLPFHCERHYHIHYTNRMTNAIRALFWKSARSDFCAFVKFLANSKLTISQFLGAIYWRHCLEKYAFCPSKFC